MENKHEKAYIAVDPVILIIKDRHLEVFLNKREKEPFKGMHELPGGLLLRGEDPEDALKRKLKSLFDTNIYFTRFGSFTAPDRDPRRRTISIGYVALVPSGTQLDHSNWFKVERLPRMAFDHREIVLAARAFLKDNINAVVAKQLLPQKFPLNRLQEVYEVIEGRKYDNRNFRKKMIYGGVVRSTGERLKNISHRPPQLYAFT